MYNQTTPYRMLSHIVSPKIERSLRDTKTRHINQREAQMAKASKFNTQSLYARAKALAERKNRLDTQIDREMRRPLPCNLKLGRLKRLRLRLKDNLASINGVMATLDRGYFRPTTN